MIGRKVSLSCVCGTWEFDRVHAQRTTLCPIGTGTPRTLCVQVRRRQHYENRHDIRDRKDKERGLFKCAPHHLLVYCLLQLHLDSAAKL